MESWNVERELKAESLKQKTEGESVSGKVEVGIE
jgi:hypothetical protein